VPSVYVLASSVTRTSARLMKIDQELWQDQAIQGSLVEPERMVRSAKPLIRAMGHGHELLLTHPNGTHLQLSLSGRPPIVDDARVDRQDLSSGRAGTTVPSGYVAAALDETFAEGSLISNLSPRYREGSITGLKWVFHNGKLSSYSMEKGRRFFERTYRSAGPERVLPALLTTGLNPRVRGMPFAEDIEAGVVTLYIGHNEDFGGRTVGTFRQAALLRGATLAIDGEVALRGGHLRRS
jgi:hypothetical protein